MSDGGEVVQSTKRRQYRAPIEVFHNMLFFEDWIYKRLEFPNSECVCSTKVGASQSRLLPELRT